MEFYLLGYNAVYSVEIKLIFQRNMSPLASGSTLKMEAKCSSETSVDFQRNILRYIPDDRTLHNHRCENLKYNLNAFLRLHINVNYFQNFKNTFSGPPEACLLLELAKKIKNIDL
jgi:hypothetical protein